MKLSLQVHDQSSWEKNALHSPENRQPDKQAVFLLCLWWLLRQCLKLLQPSDSSLGRAEGSEERSEGFEDSNIPLKAPTPERNLMVGESSKYPLYAHRLLQLLPISLFPLGVKILWIVSYRLLFNFFSSIEVELTYVTLVSGVQHRDLTSPYVLLCSPRAWLPSVTQQRNYSTIDYILCAVPFIPVTYIPSLI